MIERIQSSFKLIPLHLRNGGFPPRKPDMRMPIFWLTRSGDELFFVNDSNETVDSGHGRVEIRRGYLSTCLDTLPNPERWKGLKSIGMIESERVIKSQGTTTIERRYYISTLTNVDKFSHATRAHWGVENSLH
jgi:hypothetical protein